MHGASARLSDERVVETRRHRADDQFCLAKSTNRPPLELTSYTHFLNNTDEMDQEGPSRSHVFGSQEVRREDCQNRRNRWTSRRFPQIGADQNKKLLRKTSDWADQHVFPPGTHFRGQLKFVCLGRQAGNDIVKL